MKGTMTIIKTTGAIESHPLSSPPSLEDLQKAVGGYLEVVPHFEKFGGEWAMMFCNEEGKLHHLPPNPFAMTLTSDLFRANDYLVGDVVIISGDTKLMSQL